MAKNNRIEHCHDAFDPAKDPTAPEPLDRLLLGEIRPGNRNAGIVLICETGYRARPTSWSGL